MPSGLQVVNFTELNDAKNIWLDLIQYGLASKREDESYYEKPWFIGRIISRTNAFFF